MFVEVLIVVNVLMYDSFVSCQDASLIVVTNAKYQQEKLKFGCSPTQPTSWKSLSSITLSKNTSATKIEDIVQVTLPFSSLENETKWYSGNWQNRVTIIKQFITPIDGSGIEFDIPKEQVLCTDEGTYHCKVIGVANGGKNIDVMKTGTVQFTVEPTTINPITVNIPQPENIYNAGTLLTLNCYGSVGRPAGNLQWCFKRSTEISFTGWANNGDITQEGAIQNGCQFFRSSQLRYNVSADYEYYQFKCVTGLQQNCNSFGEISSNITIYKYTAPITGPQEPSTSNAGEIAGGVIGTFVAIVLIVVIVYFVVFKNSKKGETYRTKEENGTGAAPIDNTVYSLPHKERERDRHPEQDEQLLNTQPPPLPHQPPKHELHYADLDIASNPPGVPPPKPYKPKPKPRSKYKDPPTEYAVYNRPSPHEKSPRHYENRGLDEPHTRGRRPDMDPRGRSNPAMDGSFDDVRGDGGNGLRSKAFMGSNASFGSAV